ncbi:hypothetical protein ACN38_g9430 [Penicillium nordicum]|uniref:Uncharacterized protein n=1 Tax=Penicillium nordicum TaxID=229535 RepID=A0A0M8P246_9EURO|nr:hypothetical protein ACN38_g9430 [Penicillium nordicum]
MLYLINIGGTFHRSFLSTYLVLGTLACSGPKDIYLGIAHHYVATTQLAHVCLDRQDRSLERFPSRLLMHRRHRSFSDAATVFLVDSVPQSAHLWQGRQGHAQSAHSGI